VSIKSSFPPTRSETLSDIQFLKDEATPRWIRDVFRFLPVKSQFILSGNIRDRYPFPAEDGQYDDLPFTLYLTKVLKLKGYQRFIAFDVIDGFSAIVPRGENVTETNDFFKETFKINLNAYGRFKCSLDKSLDFFAELVAYKDQFIAVFADFASRYALRLDNLTQIEHEYFTKALKLSHTTIPHFNATVRRAQFSPIFWLCDKENDLPSWLSFENPRVRSLILPKPDNVVRRAFISSLIPGLLGFAESSGSERESYRDDFVEQTDGMVLSDVLAIAQICLGENLQFREIGEAVRRYKLGVTDDPWRKIGHDKVSRNKIANGRVAIRRRVKGQEQAAEKALDIIKRATAGLSGSQGSKVGGRPRGVLFLAGPTGVGKTELAKTLTELLFGDERAYIRFDMSEFGAEHADQRLLGAPPGYVGYDSGGELTNAIRERPFSVVLFDEIEKAHPRILDKFLQLLDDGVLTSGRGERVYFSEAIIVFTSNLGIYKEVNEEGMMKRVPNVSPDEDNHESVAKKVREEIDFYFKNKLNRPEILNRIGENIVVFDFIRPAVAIEIYEGMLQNILDRLAERQKIRVTLAEAVQTSLRVCCTRDLSNGGRGIGNQLEAWLINPLARALFDKNVGEGSQTEITALEAINGVPTLTLHLNAR
jgi:energy-coupling factor transporter ATP-binding protein EcfA2